MHVFLVNDICKKVSTTCDYVSFTTSARSNAFIDRNEKSVGRALCPITIPFGDYCGDNLATGHFRLEKREDDFSEIRPVKTGPTSVCCGIFVPRNYCVCKFSRARLNRSAEYIRGSETPSADMSCWLIACNQFEGW